MATIGENIKKYRTKLGITQKELASRLGTTPQNLAQYENDKRRPKIETLKKIANALNVSIGDLNEEAVISLSRITAQLARIDAGIISRELDNILKEIDVQTDECKNSPSNYQLDQEEISLLEILTSIFKSLNFKGKCKIISYAADLLVEEPENLKKENDKKLSRSNIEAISELTKTAKHLNHLR